MTPKTIFSFSPARLLLIAIVATAVLISCGSDGGVETRPDASDKTEDTEAAALPG